MAGVRGSHESTVRLSLLGRGRFGCADSRALRLASPKFTRSLCVIGVLALTGCKFVPPLRLPIVPTRADYTASPAPRQSGSRAERIGVQQFHYGAAPSGAWWRSFGSTQLDALVEQALHNNPGVSAAKAQLRAARASVQISAALLYPQASLELGAARTKNSGANFGGHLPGSTFSLYTGNVAVSYYPDLFGINRLVIRGSLAEMNAQRAALAAARLTLAGNLVNAAIGAAAATAELKAAAAALGAQRRLLHLLESQYRGGGVSYAAVLAQQAQLAASAAQLPPLQQQLSAYRHLLAVLLGDSPSELRAPRLALAEFTLPKDLPVTVPSTLLRNRPDIRIAEQQMRYALTGIGIAKAQFYPLVTLSASAGSNALTPGKLFDGSSTVWSIGGALAQPIFEGGKLRAQERQAVATYEATRAVYRSTVLAAFQQVADALRALQHDAALDRAQQRQREALHAQVQLAEAGYRAGAVDFSAVLLASIAYHDARIASLAITAARLQDTNALFVALGGNRHPPHAHTVGRTKP